MTPDKAKKQMLDRDVVLGVISDIYYGEAQDERNRSKR